MPWKKPCKSIISITNNSTRYKPIENEQNLKFTIMMITDSEVYICKRLTCCQKYHHRKINEAVFWSSWSSWDVDHDLHKNAL